MESQEKYRFDDILTNFWPLGGFILMHVRAPADTLCAKVSKIHHDRPSCKSIHQRVLGPPSPQGPNVLGVVKAEPGVGRSVESGLAAFRLRLTFLTMSIVHLL